MTTPTATMSATSRRATGREGIIRTERNDARLMENETLQIVAVVAIFLSSLFTGYMLGRQSRDKEVAMWESSYKYQLLKKTRV